MTGKSLYWRRVAGTLPLAGKLEEELQRFSLKPVMLNSKDPEAWREHPNDDLVFALALAAWRAKSPVPMKRKPLQYKDTDYYSMRV